MKRILAIDGGGSRGLFAIQILRRIEGELAERGETLNSFFHLIAGTSTGGIIASLIRRGKSLDEIENFYFERIPDIFRPVLSTRYRFSAEPIEESLKELFGAPEKEPVGQPLWEPGHPFEDWALGSPSLLHPPGCDGPRYLMLVLMRADTLSPWVLTNHPNAKFNKLNNHDCNLQIPLWRLVKGSAAAPFYFPPQLIWLPLHPKPVSAPSGKNHYFVDGGVSGYNNPAFKAFRVATLPQHPFNWNRGPDNLLIVSVGTGDFDQKSKRQRPDKLNMGSAAKGAIEYLMSASAIEQDYLARINSKCLYGPSAHPDGSFFAAGPIDMEVGDLTTPPPTNPQFAYVRYQQIIPKELLEVWKRQKIKISFTTRAHDALQTFKNLGQEYASQWVSADHLLLDNHSLLKKANSNSLWFPAVKTAPVWAKRNESKNQRVSSKEGETLSQIGDIICRGSEDEIWTQEPKTFESKYYPTSEFDELGFQKFLPRESDSEVLAAEIKHAFNVRTSVGILSGKPGDFIVKSRRDENEEFPDSVWVIDKAIFSDTYKRL